jgi:dihydrofolate reductase
MFSIIVACDKNRAIGKDGDLPWRQSSDLQRFKQRTLGRPIVMGRKTWQSLPGSLPGRRNIVISHNSRDDVEVLSVEEVLALDEEEICIIGGGEIYALFMPHVGIIEMTIIDTEVEDADTWFPLSDGFELTKEEHLGAGNHDDHAMTFQTWRRVE